MSVQLQLGPRDDAQWSALEGVTNATGDVTVSAPINWDRLYAIRFQYPAANLGPGLTGFIEFQFVQNSIERLPTNTDPYRVPITDDSEPVLYTPPKFAQPLQFIVRGARYQGAAINTAAVRVFVLHSLSKC